MDFRTLILIMAIAFAFASAADLSVTNNSPVDSGSEATGLYRSKRQFYPGYGGFSGSSANAGASSFGGGGGYPGGFSGSSAFASANSNSFGK